MNNKITQEKTYRGYDINNGKKKDFTCFIKTLDQVIDMTEYMVTKHSKSMFIRLDIRNEVDSEKKLERQDITRIIENTDRALNRKYKGNNKPDMHTVWTCENEDGTPHYHLFIGANGNAIQNGYAIFQEVSKAVQGKLGTENSGLVEFSSSNGCQGIRINRSSEKLCEDINKAIYAGSYLAKTRSKEGRKKGARISSASRLPEDWRNRKMYKEIFGNINNEENVQLKRASGTENYCDDDNYTCMHPPVEEFIEFDDE